MSIEEDAVWLSKAVLKLDKNGFIQTFEEDEELHCENLRGAAVYFAKKIQTQAARNLMNESEKP